MSGPQSFWARRRAGVAAEAQARDAEIEAQERAEIDATLEDKTDAELLAELELPDPDTMKQGDDFSAFMAKAVPDRIRRRALRTLWRSNPVLANVDMLVDYGEDFTDSATVIENMQTAYQVGKGMLKHVEEMARQAEARARAEEAGPEVEEPADGSLEDIALAEELASDEAETPVDQIAYVEEEGAEVAQITTPRRMKFSIEDAA